jgi:hypothetical protein
MIDCWAARLGNCSDKMSREHTVTKEISLDNEVTVGGMPWRVDKKVGLALPVGGLA